MSLPLRARAGSEGAMVERWLETRPRGLRLEDGRALRVVFPGTAGGGAGPDVTGAMLDASGDFLRGEIEFHLRASGWRQHGHHLDPAYAGVVLHVVAENDTGALATLHGAGRSVPVLVLGEPGRRPLPFAPPCTETARDESITRETLERLGGRRLAIKAARVAPLVAGAGAGQALYTLLLETLGGPANRGTFSAIARSLPLEALLERAKETGTAAESPTRRRALTAELRWAAASLSLRLAGVRPQASPQRRLDLAAAIAERLWPGIESGWPALLAPATDVRAALRIPGLSAPLRTELAVNAVLPVALASGEWEEADVLAAWRALPAPAVYGKLRRLERWLGGAERPPFRTAARLQGGLLLHADYCSRGRCGSCPLSDGQTGGS